MCKASSDATAESLNWTSASGLSDRLEHLLRSRRQTCFVDRVRVEIVSWSGLLRTGALTVLGELQASKRWSARGSQWLDFGASELVLSGFGVLVAHL